MVVNDWPGSRRVRPLPVWKAFGGQVIGSVPSPSASACGAQGVAGVDLDDRVVLVDPQLGSSGIGGCEAHPCSSVLVTVQIGEGCVEFLVAEAFAGPEVEVCSFDGRRPGWELTLVVGKDAGGGAELEGAVVDQAGSW